LYARSREASESDVAFGFVHRWTPIATCVGSADSEPAMCDTGYTWCLRADDSGRAAARQVALTCGSETVPVTMRLKNCR